MALFYRFLRRWPRTVEYRDGTIALEVASRKADSQWAQTEWVLQARKIGSKAPPCVIFSLCMPRNIFDHALFDGFPVEDGTPEAKIMERLERFRYAESFRGRR